MKLKILIVISSFIIYTSCTPHISPVGIHGDIAMTPYLQAITDSSVVVLVESITTKDIEIEYGQDEGYSNTTKSFDFEATTANPTSYVHRILLSNLASGQTYNYRIKNSTSKEFGGKFTTAHQKASKFRFATIGDTRTNEDTHNEIAKLMLEKNPIFSIYSGDLCANPSYSSFKHEFFVPNQLLLAANVPFMNAVGNHEEWSQNTKAFTYSNFENKHYYSFDYGNIHFLVLSSEHNVSVGSEQRQFAIKDLKQSEKDWKIVMFHKPAYCGGGHGENTAMKMLSEEVFVSNKVDIVITGHSHFYQRNFVDGIHHIVSAGGGAPLYTPKKMNYTIAQAKEHHFIIFDVNGIEIQGKVYNLHNEIIDEFKISKE